MLLDASAAKALFAIVLATAQGPEMVNRQLPLHVTDRGDSWLVTGTPYTDETWQMRFYMCHMFFAKRSAEVMGVGCHGRMMPAENGESYWSKLVTSEQRDAISRPEINFEPDGVHELWDVLYHGIVNSPAAAAEYAAVLMRTKPGWSTTTAGDLLATERDKVWHITGRDMGPDDLLTISRSTGKVLSGDL